MGPSIGGRARAKDDDVVVFPKKVICAAAARFYEQQNRNDFFEKSVKLTKDGMQLAEYL